MKLLRYTINFGQGYIDFYIFLTKNMQTILIAGAGNHQFILFNTFSHTRHAISGRS